MNHSNSRKDNAAPSFSSQISHNSSGNNVPSFSSQISRSSSGTSSGNDGPSSSSASHYCPLRQQQPSLRQTWPPTAHQAANYMEALISEMLQNSTGPSQPTLTQSSPTVCGGKVSGVHCWHRYCCVSDLIQQIPPSTFPLIYTRTPPPSSFFKSFNVDDKFTIPFCARKLYGWRQFGEQCRRFFLPSYSFLPKCPSFLPKCPSFLPS